MEPIYDVLAWSMGALALGTHPSRDYRGAEFPSGSKQALRAGKPICGGFRLVLCEILGDWKFLKEEFRMKHHYGTNECCWMCKATKRVGALSAFDFRDGAQWQGHPRTHDEYVQSVGHNLSICTLPGFHISMIRPDLLHIGLLGVVQWAVAGTLWELCEEGRWAVQDRGPWQVRFGLQLQRAFLAFQNWLRVRGLSCSQPKFSCAMLSKSSLQSWPFFKGKAANTLFVARWLADVLKEHADMHPQDVHAQQRAAMVWGFVEVFRVCSEGRQWLSDAEARALTLAREASLLCYSALAGEASNTQPPKAMYPLKPKHHAWDHALRAAIETKRNPAWHWTFCDEDFIGRVKRIAARTHPNTMAMRTLQRYLCRLFSEISHASGQGAA